MTECVRCALSNCTVCVSLVPAAVDGPAWQVTVSQRAD